MNGYYYSIVDMSAHGGLGDVISLNNPLFAPGGEVNHAVKHGNCKDYWIVGREWLNNTYRAYLLTSSGLSAPVITSIGVAAGSLAYGQGKFSPDATRYAIADGAGGTLQLFDFDPLTGIFSNALTLYDGSGYFGQTYGLSFSPDNEKLYAAQERMLTVFTSGTYHQAFQILFWHPKHILQQLIYIARCR